MTPDATADRRPDTSLLITVSGRSGAGVPTLCEGLSDALDCASVSGGEVFRDLADERDLGLTRFVAKASDSGAIDREIDPGSGPSPRSGAPRTGPHP